jgi:hypothetical protein
MENCRNCELNCPVILAADQTAKDLQARLETLALREADRQDAVNSWATIIAEADPAQRMEPLIIDGESLGTMYTQRDASEVFSTIARKGDDDVKVTTTNQLRRLEGDIATRMQACERGPRKKYRLFGSTVCRSEIEG